jgi:hypothetical protein
MRDRAFAKPRLLLIAGVAAVAVASTCFAPLVDHAPVICPLRALTGFPCPGCGLTRAFLALGHGDIGAAVAFHAFSLPLAALMLIAAMSAAAELVAGRQLVPARWLYSRRLAVLVACALVTYHVIRCVIWFHDGTLLHEYLESSWPYHLLVWAGWLG